MVKKFKERIVYCKNPPNSENIEILTGKSINYPQVIESGNTVEELKSNILRGIKAWMNHTAETIQTEDDLEAIELDPESWFWNEANTTYWEMERFKYLMMSRPDYRDQVLAWMKERFTII
jgi:hypothetical protein